MIKYIKQFIQDSKNEVKALKDIGLLLFLYQTIIRIFIFTIFGISYSFFIYWILKNPLEDYVFLTGLATLDYIYIDRLIIVFIFTIFLFLFSFFIETFGVISISRQYYLGKKVSFKNTFLDIIKYFKINLKVQILKYMYFFSNIVFLIFLLYVIYLFLPNFFGLVLSCYFILKNIILLINKTIDYKDVGQKIFENKGNIFGIYAYKISNDRKKRIFKFYIFKLLFITVLAIILPFTWLYITWFICKLSLNHEILTSLLLGINSAIAILIAIIFSYLYISFFSLRATRIYLEIQNEKANQFQKYGKKIFLNYKIILFIIFIIFSILQSIFFYNFFHINVIKDKEITIFAHRASMMAETNNSLEALQYSIKNKIEFVEIDVQLSKEGIPIIFHDYTYFDGKQTKYIQNTPLSELKQFDLKTKKNILHKNDKGIPTLEEFLQKAKGKIKVNIEIKTTKNFEIELSEKVANVIKKLQMQNDIIITSFDYKILKNIKKLLPNIKTGLIITAYIGKIYEIDSMEVDWLMINNLYYMIYKSTFDTFKDKKIALWSFDPGFNSNDFLYEEQVKGVIVDNPVEIRKEIQYYNDLSIGEKYYKQIENLFILLYGRF